MSGQSSENRPNDQWSQWIIFCISIAIMVILCFKGGGGFIGTSPLHFSNISHYSGNFVIQDGKFIILYAMTWLFCMILFLFFPRGLTDQQSIGIIMISALICRLLLLPHPSSDDINRYLWEGRLINTGINPYHFAPNDFKLTYLAMSDPFYSHINHPDLPAIYPPMVLCLFALAGRIIYHPMMIKAIIIGFDIGALIFLLKLLQNRNLPLRWAILYALNPVILYSFAGCAHLDAIHLFFILGILYLYDLRNWALMFVFTGFAIQSKYIALLGFPFLIRRDNRQYAWLAVAAMLVPYLSFIDAKWPQLFYCVRRFTCEYAFNGSVHFFFQAALGSIQLATHICQGLLLMLIFWGYVHFHPEKREKYQDNPVIGYFYVFSVLLILSPTVHFWYLTWIVPLLALLPGMSWLILCLTIGVCFIAEGNLDHTGHWYIPVWVQALEWALFGLLLLPDIYYFCLRCFSPWDPEAPKSVSVLIPVLNEASNITSCIEHILKDESVCEIIVIDSGSKDQTEDLAKTAGAMVIRHLPSEETGYGRGGQIHFGLQSARSDVIAVVHADILVYGKPFTKILKIMARQPDIIGGAIGTVFKSNDWRYRLLEFANDFRAIFLKISFGDQIQFFRRKPVVDKDVFPKIPLMEDVEFSLRLNHMGRQVYLFGDSQVSSRKWKSEGIKRVWVVIKLVFQYLFYRLYKKPDTLGMFNEYYGKRYEY